MNPLKVRSRAARNKSSLTLPKLNAQGGGVWGNGFTSLRRVVFSFVTGSRASVVVFVCTCTVSSLVLSFLLSGFYVRLLQCVEFPLTHARTPHPHLSQQRLVSCNLEHTRISKKSILPHRGMHADVRPRAAVLVVWALPHKRWVLLGVLHRPAWQLARF